MPLTYLRIYGVCHRAMRSRFRVCSARPTAAVRREGGTSGGRRWASGFRREAVGLGLLPPLQSAAGRGLRVAAGLLPPLQAVGRRRSVADVGTAAGVLAGGPCRSAAPGWPVLVRCSGRWPVVRRTATGDDAWVAARRSGQEGLLSRRRVHGRKPWVATSGTHEPREAGWTAMDVAGGRTCRRPIGYEREATDGAEEAMTQGS